MTQTPAESPAGTNSPALAEPPALSPPAPASRAPITIGADGKPRCAWATSAPEYIAYHDDEWGRPLHSDRRIFEKICLEGFQSGLSWITILRRRDAFRRAFHNFDFTEIAKFDESDVERLLTDASIIRHRGKIRATIANARVTASLVDGHPGALDELVWSFAPLVDDQHPHPRARSFADLPASTPDSVALSKQLRALGFSFVGPTTMYALMQSGGLVDDHLEGCFLAT